MQFELGHTRSNSYSMPKWKTMKIAAPTLTARFSLLWKIFWKLI